MAMTSQFFDMMLSSDFFDVVFFLLSSLVTGPSFMSISSRVLELWQLPFIRDWPEIRKSEVPPPEFCSIFQNWVKLGIPNLPQMSQMQTKFSAVKLLNSWVVICLAWSENFILNFTNFCIKSSCTHQTTSVRFSTSLIFVIKTVVVAKPLVSRIFFINISLFFF